MTTVFNKIKDRQNTHVYLVDFIPPITYVGIDIKRTSVNTLIYADHYTFGANSNLIFFAKPGCEPYYIYKKQIFEIDSMNKTKLL